jgi:protein-S-isoprenylcysteine O-methyltransferase
MTQHLPQIIGPLWGLSELCLGFAKRSRSGATSKDRHSLMVIWLVYFITIPSAIVAAYHLPRCRIPGPAWVAGLGLGLFVLGLILRLYSIIHLGRFFTVNVAIAPDHRLVATGPYRFVRHPSYTGAMLAAFGFALSFQNLASLLIIFVPCCAVMRWRIYVEERALLEALGEEYRSYMRRTKRLLPLIY